MTAAKAETNDSETLRTLLSQPPSQQAAPDSSYFYNVGTLYLRDGKLGPALAYLEKANRLSPGDADIQQNLGLAKTSLSRLIGTDRLDPASSWLESAVDSLPTSAISGIVGFLALIVSLICCAKYRRSRQLRESFFSLPGLLTLTFLMLLTLTHVAERIVRSRPAAVLLEPHVIRSAPSDDSLELGQVQAGTKVRVIGAASTSWRQVRFNADSVGWLPSSSLLLLSAP